MLFEDLEAYILDEIPTLEDRNRLKRAANHVLDTISGVMYGILETEQAVECKVVMNDKSFVIHQTADYTSLITMAPVSLVNSSYKWTVSPSDANSYYLEAAAGGDPGISEPSYVLLNQKQEDEGDFTAGLGKKEWDWGDFDTLGFDTLYVRLVDNSDPDTKADDYIEYINGTDFTWTGEGFAVGQEVWLPDVETDIDGGAILSVDNVTLTVDKTPSIVNETVTSDVLAFSVTTDYTWDYDNRILTLPYYLNELLAVLVDDVKFTRWEHEHVYDTTYDDDEIYTVISRDEVKIASGSMGAEGEVLKICMLRDLKSLTAVTATTEIDIPAQLDRILRDGVIYELATQPDFRDELTIEKHQADWESGLAFAEDLEVNRLPNVTYDKDHDYGK